MDTLVTADWLSEHTDDPGLVVLDCTVGLKPGGSDGFESISGRGAYDAGHIPSAGFADLLSDLSDTTSHMEFALPAPDRFCSAIGELGVGDNSWVVLYDTSFSVWAARVWWMLKWVGFDRAALLDGGMGGWKSAGHPVSTEPVHRPPRVLTPNPRPELIAEADEVLAAVGNATVTLVDTLPEEHFSGETQLYERPGHIPGAINISALSLLDESGRLRSPEELAPIVGDNTKGRTITYCGGGIAASLNAFVMTRLGFSDVAVYIASLEEWVTDPANPLCVAEPDESTPHRCA